MYIVRRRRTLRGGAVARRTLSRPRGGTGGAAKPPPSRAGANAAEEGADEADDGGGAIASPDKKKARVAAAAKPARAKLSCGPAAAKPARGAEAPKPARAAARAAAVNAGGARAGSAAASAAALPPKRARKAPQRPGDSDDDDWSDCSDDAGGSVDGGRIEPAAEVRQNHKQGRNNRTEWGMQRRRSQQNGSPAKRLKQQNRDAGRDERQAAARRYLRKACDVRLHLGMYYGQTCANITANSIIKEGACAQLGGVGHLPAALQNQLVDPLLGPKESGAPDTTALVNEYGVQCKGTALS